MTGEPVLLRAEAGPEVGFGHLMRCVALAEGLRERGASPLVALPGHALSSSAVAATCRDIPIARVAARAVCEDRGETVSLMRARGISTAITDVCTQPALERPAALDAFHAGLRAEATFLMVLAAGRHLDPAADVVVNPYVLPKPPEAEPPRVLWGPEYFIFRPEFIRAARVSRQIAAAVTRVAIAVGGSDPAGLTPHVIDAVGAAARPGMTLRVVVGPGMSAEERARIGASVAGHPGVWQLIEQPDDMAELFLWADVAVTGDGLTKYETAVTGTPSVIVARPNSDPRLNQAFETGGSTVAVAPDPAGHWPDLRAVVARLMSDAGWRQKMSECGRALVDGYGRERVLNRIPKVGVA